nr:HAMP domain-containing sensor histidine kinase [Aquicoccus sp. G2-2]MEA1113852.1 HAMP domain-containing sensor histidine kinase [Aquicoccus sp. G2-2]
MFENSPSGQLVHDDKGNILDTNSRLRDWLGMAVSDLDGIHVIEVFSKASRIVYETSIAPLLVLKGQVDGASLDLVSKDGTKVPVLLSAESTEVGGERTTTIAFLLADARRALERDLAKARAEAEAELLSTQREGELREQFVAILGHDLRNPLASISSAVRMLSRETLSDRGNEILKLTQGSVQRMSLLITNILDFARNRLGGGIELNISDDADLEIELTQVVNEFRSAQPDCEIRLDIAKQGSVSCDVPRVGQLLSNLLGNAVTYGDSTQPIYVAVKTMAEGAFELSVKNSGEPIPPSAVERLFDPFVRPANHENQMGLGLGLYIASEIAKAHDGRLDVISNDEWTKFTFRMPQDQFEY